MFNIGLRNLQLMYIVFYIILIDIVTGVTSGGILYPQESLTREVKSLDGIWNFRKADDPLQGFKEHWYDRDLALSGEVIPMPVPSSYNDITVSRDIRDHVGVVWYDRTFYVPDSWRQQGYRVWLRFGSVHYFAQVYVNGKKVMVHEIGHLPFHKEITSVVRYGAINRLTVAVDNTLSNVTIPQGSQDHILTDNGTKIIQSYTFDFFNYAGIHRPVCIYSTPTIYIDDITINTDIDGTTGYIYYNVSTAGSISDSEDITCSVTLLDKHGNEVLNVQKIEDVYGFSGRIEVTNASFWWPYMMHPNPGYLYSLMVVIQRKRYDVLDIYMLNAGIRTIRWDSNSFRINGVPAYIRGVGRHEDSDIRGKGLDYALVTRDYNMLKWLGLNSYRTSHYPYAEEIMDFADKQGIMIIDECPAVDVELFSPTLLQKHMDSLGQLIRRDKNRPSVVMWSVANEPRSSLPGAGNYFRSVVDYVRSLDTSRPLTAAIATSYVTDKLAQYLDIIGFNRYNAWYKLPGRLETVQVSVENEATEWHRKHNKPVLMTEYGADTMPGLHLEPEYVWSEEYQVKLLSEHFKAFDNLRNKNFFIGEMIWNFADFKTAQTYTRVGGNKKGLLTRERQPKAAAHHLRSRNFKLAQLIDNYQLPADLELEKYTAPSPVQTNRIEL
ncbi:beta-glucuronidase-like isoform X1 [Lycorma delicatula]|uniref:beta-glucuronidase-like isoform X1 n=2 Tax=Lycorma delicatula TaxID=130591 RepID=UPI003F516489